MSFSRGVVGTMVLTIGSWSALAIDLNPTGEKIPPRDPMNVPPRETRSSETSASGLGKCQARNLLKGPLAAYIQKLPPEKLRSLGFKPNDFNLLDQTLPSGGKPTEKGHLKASQESQPHPKTLRGPSDSRIWQEAISKLGRKGLDEALLGRPKPNRKHQIDLPNAKSSNVSVTRPIAFAPRTLKLNQGFRIRTGERRPILMAGMPAARLIAFDPKIPAQIAFIREKLKQTSLQEIHLLVKAPGNGDLREAEDLMIQFERPVYFLTPDLVDHLGVKALPAEINMDSGLVEVREWAL